MTKIIIYDFTRDFKYYKHNPYVWHYISVWIASNSQLSLYLLSYKNFKLCLFCHFQAYFFSDFWWCWKETGNKASFLAWCIFTGSSSDPVIWNQNKHVMLSLLIHSWENGKSFSFYHLLILEICSVLLAH